MDYYVYVKPRSGTANCPWCGKCNVRLMELNGEQVLEKHADLTDQSCFLILCVGSNRSPGSK